MQSIRWQRAIEAEGDLLAALRPAGEHDPDRLVPETADRELERGSRWSVEPLDVVNHQQHRSDARALAQEGEEGRGDGASVEPGLRLLP